MEAATASRYKIEFDQVEVDGQPHTLVTTRITAFEVENTKDWPLVSIGVAVRNGGARLEGTLERLVAQTYSNLEILISDNCSTDNTADICRRFAEQDSRVRYYRQEKPLTGLEHYRYVFQNTRGDYFMWAAYDDRHTLNYVEVLLQAALAHPGCSLVFSEVADFSQYEPFNGVKLDYSFASDDATPFFKKLRRTVESGRHLYGLHRRAALDHWYWYDSDFGWDTMLLAFEVMRGAFVKAEGAAFFCYRPADHGRVKSPAQRARDNSYREIAPFFRLRWCWQIVRAGCYAEKLNGRRHSVLVNFLRLYMPYVWWLHLKHRLFKSAPPFAIKLWRSLKLLARPAI